MVVRDYDHGHVTDGYLVGPLNPVNHTGLGLVADGGPGLMIICNVRACVCVRACVRAACVRACCVRVCSCACVCVRACVYLRA